MSNTNKIFLIVIIVFIVAGCAGVFVLDRIRGTVTLVNGKYINEQYSFEITPPPTWKIKEVAENYVMFYGPKEKDLNTILTISIKDNVTEDLDSYVNSKKSRLINDPEYKEFISLRKTKIGDMQAYELVYANIAKKESASKKWYEPFNKHKELFFMKDDKRLRITYVVAYSKYETYLRIVDKSIKSFRFTPAR